MLNPSELRTLRQQLTLDEKISMLHGEGLFQTAGVPRLNIPSLIMSDGPMGVRQEFPLADWSPLGLTNDFVTYFPSNVALAATWDLDHAKSFGIALGKESRGRGKDVILAPGINILRSPLCGRNFEYMSEDPYLISQLVVPFIQGIQSQDVAACVKHFAVNNQEHKRLEVSVEVSERALNEIYFPGFKAAVELGDTYTIMGAYNRLHGEFCCEHTTLLKDVLRDTWGFDGIVISDWGAVHHTLKAASGGLDIEMSVSTDFANYYFAKPLSDLVKKGLIDESLINEKVDHILGVMSKLNMLDGERKNGTYNTPEHHKLTHEMARDAIVLLKNDNHFLPLDSTLYKRIAIIGENGNRLHSNGGGSAEIKALYEISPLLGLSMHLGSACQLNYYKGYSSDPTMDIHGANFLREEAMKAANSHDLVIFIGGLNHDYDSEGKDKPDMLLPYYQYALIDELYEMNPKMIVVNISGSPVDMRPFAKKVPAIIQSWYAGMNGGLALAEVLFGAHNPCGKLPMSYPARLEDNSAHSLGEFPGDDTVAYREDFMIGYRHHDTHQIPALFPFGHGLSYTNFDYSDLKTTIHKDGPNTFLDLQLTLANTGTRLGSEIIQVYVEPIHPRMVRPLKELKAFKKVTLGKNTSTSITLNLPTEAFMFFDDSSHQWVFEPGDYRILIGSSSTDIRLHELLSL